MAANVALALAGQESFPYISPLYEKLSNEAKELGSGNQQRHVEDYYHLCRTKDYK